MKDANYIDAVEIQPLIDISTLTLQTAFVKDNVDGYRPASLLFVGRPESGKSLTITEFRNLPFVYFTNEITVKTIVDDILRQMENKNIRFILIPDILNCVKKQTYTREPLLQTLKSLVDEGIINIRTPHKIYSYKSAVKGGLISAITREDLYATQGRFSLYSDLKRMGFLSRMIPFTYDYPINKIIKIFKYIKSGKIEGQPIVIPKIKTNKKEKHFELNPELFSDLERVSINLARYSDSYGFRIQKNLQKLCYANALINDRDHVTQEDIDKILYLSKWINFDFNPL